MASIFITTTARDTPWYPWAHSNYLRVMRSAQLSANGPHTLANHPAAADVVLFVEPARRFQTDVTRSAMYRTYRDKSLVLDFSDNPLTRLPGLYVSLTKSEAATPWYRSGFYVRVADNALFEPYERKDIQPDLLFSFVGRVANSPTVRKSLLQLNHPRAVLRDGSTNQSDNDTDYIATLYRSKFVLAPKGHGASSWRLFETMRAGRVPVIISDAWEAPQGLPWPEFSLRIAEHEIEAIPQILESIEDRAMTMGLRARDVWKRCFSLENCFQWIAGQSMELLDTLQRSGGVTPAPDFFMKALRAGSTVPYIRELLGATFHSGR